jgi:hypothetical protein
MAPNVPAQLDIAKWPRVPGGHPAFVRSLQRARSCPFGVDLRRLSRPLSVVFRPPALAARAASLRDDCRWLERIDLLS